MEFQHAGTYNANIPVLIFSKKPIGVGGKRQITGVVKDGDNFLEVGDIIHSFYIGNSATESLPYKSWVVVEITDRNTPKGHFIIDIKNAGFVAIVEPNI